jgi:hypothetical protein
MQSAARIGRGCLTTGAMQPDVFTMNPDGSHLIQVTDTPVTENFPNWGTHPVIP